MRIVFSWFVLCVLFPSLSFAALGRTTGKEWERWGEDRYNVVLAEISRIKQVDNTGLYEAVIKPKATLAGAFDPSLHPSLPVKFHAQTDTTSIRDVPSEGAMVMIVMKFIPPENKGDLVRGIIVSDICAFMPESSSLVQIRGMDDLAVAATLERLQYARAHADPSPYEETKPAPKSSQP